MEFKAKDRRLEGRTTLRQVQLTELYILDVIDEICKKFQLRYFLSAGTLLGCLRHKGFIPWDDDLDIGMPMIDYKKFIKVAPAVLPANLMLQTPKTVPGCFEMFAKIRDLSSLALESFSDVTCPSGIYVDVFPVEKFPLLPKWFRGMLTRGLSLTWRRSRLHRVANHRFCMGVFISGVKACLWSLGHAFLRFFFNLLKLFSPTILHTLPEAGATLLEIGEGDIFPLSQGMFEGRLYPIPRNAAKYLSVMYGNWQELPPPEKRTEKHSNIFYPIQTMGFWWTVPHASLSKEEAEGIDRIAQYLVKI